jgi:hypothetical protein
LEGNVVQDSQIKLYKWGKYIWFIKIQYN